jgi:hypothetical protein
METFRREAKTPDENSTLVLREREMRKLKDEVNRRESQQIEPPLRKKSLHQSEKSHIGFLEKITKPPHLLKYLTILASYHTCT